ncbi:chemotaxis response regulator protein-glutamate methylesterase [Telmatospirillum sp.]|uniref:protein-glutamate methylesterase/protein-glutamine glutaminase n=1 Tax=Telmatospirillum sp. TaxID=2079197 RepID=UPI00284A68A6|nr:chemotaxis response regulator protein-glutamate methylesterase [Telmatospirillum sp.]MDR3435215.1 chemotaxis response regulator protein-glutamate methylesterase [Telmatospirillum sp.]
MAGKKIKVLIVDDSAVVRQVLAETLESDPGIAVMGVASDPYAAAKIIETEIPDVITLDIEMPRMDGLTFLEKIMSQYPIPVVMCSSLTDEGCATALRAMECGAVAIITKPKIGVKAFLEESRITICDAVKSANSVKPQRLTMQPRRVEQKLSADVMLAKAANRSMIQTTEKVVVIGASTGGTEALRTVLVAMPSDAPGIVIVQHMPEKFTAAFATQLDRECRITVKEAENNDTVMRGTALIAPGNRHTLLKRSGARYFVEVREGPLVSRHRPSVDVLFRSAARYAGGNAVGVIMTGMGDDGAHGILELKEAKAKTLAQDEESCVVFGMPNEAIKLGAVDKVVPLSAIANEILRACS